VVGVDHILQGFEVERCGKTRRVDEVAEHDRQVALLGGGARRSRHRNSAGEVCRAERVDGGAQFLAVAERQAELAQIGVSQARQYRRIDLLGAKEFGVFRQAYLLQPSLYVDSAFLPKSMWALAPLRQSSDALKGLKVLAMLPVRDV
jgi:hypothetical protein